MLYVFTIKDSVLGICDEEHLKNTVSKVWKETTEDGTSNEVVVYGIDEMNVVEAEPTFISYYFDKYDDEDGKTKLGLRLIGLGGEIDMPLDIEL